MKKQTALLLSTMVLMTAATVQPAHAFKFFNKKSEQAIVAPVKTEVKEVEVAAKTEVKKVDTVVKQDVKKVEKKLEPTKAAVKPIAKAPAKAAVKSVAKKAACPCTKTAAKAVAKVAPKAPVKK